MPQRTIPASMQPQQTSFPAHPHAQQPAPTADMSEIRGYTLAFIAYKYNQECNLGFSKENIDFLLAQLKSMEGSQGITPEVISDNTKEAERYYNADKQKFCADAQKIGAMIKNMFTQMSGLGQTGLPASNPPAKK